MLRERLLAVARLVTPVKVVADVGTGDALLACHLVRTGRARRVIATDARPGPLEQARAVVAGAGLAGSVELRLGEGLAALRPGEAETAVLAGMGARTLVAALEAAPAVLAGMGARTLVAALEAAPAVLAELRRLVLQPNGDPGFIRGWLLAHRWRLVEEDLVLDRGRFYQVLAAEPAGHVLAAEPAGQVLAEQTGRVLAEQTGAGREPDLPPPELLAAGLEVGPRLWERRHPLLGAYLDHRVAVLSRAVAAAPSPDRVAGTAHRLEALRTLRRRLRGLG